MLVRIKAKDDNAMLKSITFKNFRNLHGKYAFDQTLNIIFGENNSGKTNILEGIKLAFSSLTNDFFKIKQSDFRNSNDNIPITISVELEPGSIASLDYLDGGTTKCGFKVSIAKTPSGRYARKTTLGNGGNLDYEIVREDPGIPNICTIPLVRTEDLYSDGLITGISSFIENEERYKTIIDDSRESIRESLKTRIEKFNQFCKKFGQDLNVDFTNPRIVDEKAYIVDGDLPHNHMIGSGYKSIATIIINTLNDKFNVVLIDEIENHLHPSVIRNLIRELRVREDCIIVATTHSPVVINEAKAEELMSSRGSKLSALSPDVLCKLNTFLHPGRAEIVFAEKVILVEGYTEELLLRHYLAGSNNNWTIINVAGVMFDPYIELASLLNKRAIVISDTDIVLDETLIPSTRFENLKAKCEKAGMKIVAMWNTLESDLFRGGFLECCPDFVEPHKDHAEVYVAKQNRKIAIARTLIENSIDLSEWHVIKEIKDEFQGD